MNFYYLSIHIYHYSRLFEFYFILIKINFHNNKVKWVNLINLKRKQKKEKRNDCSIISKILRFLVLTEQIDKIENVKFKTK